MIDEVHVTVSVEMVRQAVTEADWQTNYALTNKLGAGHGEASRSRERRIRHNRVGLIGQAAVCAYLGIPFDGARGSFAGKGDVAGLEIRTSTLRYPSLTIFPNDDFNRPTVLVSIRREDPPFRAALLGWCRPCDVQEHLEDARPKLRPGSPLQWHVHRQHLLPMSAL